MKTILSYNVNGIRAAAKKGFFDWMQEAAPDIVCVQETKAQPDQLDAAMLNPPGYFGYWHSAEKKGYSGVAIFTREQPLHVEVGCGIPKYDSEGRVLRCDYPGFSVMSVYLPSGSSGEHRQVIKEEFMPDFYEYVRGLLQEHPNLILSGDFNIAHQEIDIHDPKGNKNSSGFLPHEREWFGKFLGLGFEDSFRAKNEGLQAYSWWSQRSRAREQNKGWRIDYHLLSASLTPRCVAAAILPEVAHSDHCPISVTIE
jgi:exodeoxyribonuclease-3